ncbi:MAG: sigma-54-dependent Fis family transcriptional regulator [Myxococcales bacterium]|nr:sigma-54-dependent Fis family transcriptional regulator [Myxococcales bacterium]
MTKSQPKDGATTAPRVLVVDDEEDLCELIAMRLEHHGFEVVTETSYAGAKARIHAEILDAVVLDLRLEDGDGLDLLEEVRRTEPDLPILILTAHGSIETAVEAVKKGAQAFLTKPFHDHELLRKLDDALVGAELRRELAEFRRMVGGNPSQQLIGKSEPIKQVRELIARVASTDSTVLITGESGTGKELAARKLHTLSPRREGPFVALNCAALPADLLESELFGHAKGAFTGAHQDKTGLLSAADGGTVFLDEIGDAPMSIQAKLLRVLQERTYVPVGSTRERSTDVRIVAATNRDLQADIADGRFREDLFYRLHVVPIRMPPLRERREDILPLAEHFLRKAATKHDLGRVRLTPSALGLLRDHDWPGNVRELANVVEAAAVLASGGLVDADALEVAFPRSSQEANAIVRDESEESELSLPPMSDARQRFDRAYLVEVLRRTQGNVSAAARLAGRNRTDFHDLLRRHGIDPNDFRS